MKTLSLRIPERLDQQLSHEVARRRVPKSVFVREALEQRLNGSAKARKQPSLLDLAGDLVGIHKGGPSDLSTNPKYMDGFGE